MKIKGLESGKHLNDPDKDKIESKTDPRLDFPLKMTCTIQLMDSGKREAKIKGVTGDTTNAFHSTLHDMVYMIKKLRCGI